MKTENLTLFDWQIISLCQQYELADLVGIQDVAPFIQMILSWGDTERILKGIQESELNIAERFYTELDWAFHNNGDYVETVNAECVENGSFQGI